MLNVLGWHTNDPGDILRERIQQNTETTVARLLGNDADNHSTRSTAPIPIDER